MKAKLCTLKNVTANSLITDCNTNVIQFIFSFASQYQFISWSRLLPSARVGGRHDGQNSDEDVDRVHVYSNRPAEKHNFFQLSLGLDFWFSVPNFALI